MPLPRASDIVRPKRLEKFANEDVTIARAGSELLSALCRGKAPKPDFDRLATALDILRRLLEHDDPDVMVSACSALADLADGLDPF